MFKIIILFISLVLTIASYKVSDFQQTILKPSPPSGYHAVDTGDQTIGQILAFGDLNGDQYNDYVATPNRNQSQLYLYFWDNINGNSLDDLVNFIQDSFQIKSNSIKSIRQVMLSKFNHNSADLTSDGRQQIIITVENDQDKMDTIIYKLQNCSNFKCQISVFKVAQNHLKNMTNQPFLVNFKGQTTPSFFIFQGKRRYIVQKDPDNESIYNKNSFAEYLDTEMPNNFNQVDKHYASNIDFSGDCHSDLVILSHNQQNACVLQFYQKKLHGALNKVQQIEFPLPILYFTFVDIDSSGTIDIALLLRNQTEYQFHILPNNLNKVDEICQQNQQFPFDIKNLQKADFKDELSQNSKLIFGDINSDSYPDLLTIITNQDFKKATIYKNEQNHDKKRKFEPSDSLNSNLVSDLKNPVQATFFDLAENGILDIIITTEQTKASDGQLVITRNCIMNNVKDDTLFIKILPLSQASVYSLSSKKISSAFGITMQWRITALDGNKYIKLLNQKSQWNYGTLQLPFVCGGLGRTNNYVQDLTVGYEGVGQKMNWSPVIPNSKLLIYQKDEQWSLETLLTNSERVNQVVIVSVVILIVLGIIVIFLSHRQKVEDRKDHYNFIQLIR